MPVRGCPKIHALAPKNGCHSTQASPAPLEIRKNDQPSSSLHQELLTFCYNVNFETLRDKHAIQHTVYQLYFALRLQKLKMLGAALLTIERRSWPENGS